MTQNKKNIYKAAVFVLAIIICVVIFCVAAMAAEVTPANGNASILIDTSEGVQEGCHQITADVKVEKYISKLEAAIAEATKKANERIKARQKAEAEAAAEAVDTRTVAEKVVDDAWYYVGWLPYVWAGEDLNYGVDCSGFTRALYAQYGYDLSHDSNEQSCQGISVPYSEAKPGDIIVYYGHVALYIGDGLIIHASDESIPVSVAGADFMEILDVRRIVY